MASTQVEMAVKRRTLLSRALRSLLGLTLSIAVASDRGTYVLRPRFNSPSYSLILSLSSTHHSFIMPLPEGFENYYAILGVPNGVDSVRRECLSPRSGETKNPSPP